MNKHFILSLILASCVFAPVQAQSDDNLFDLLAQSREDQWETHIGFGLNFGFLGLPSQVANALAVKEGYLTAVTEAKGLPMGMNIFTGFGYKVTPSTSMGLEFGAGIHMDGGKARVQLGDTLADPNSIPGYVYDLIFGNAPSFFIPPALGSTPAMYQWLSTMNTMKGFYLDPKVRIYYRYTQPKWHIQTGVGAGLIIPFGYYAYPSKDPHDYKKFGATSPISWPMSQIYLMPVRIPFPLMLRDGTSMMKAFQPVADFHVRTAYKLGYLELGYSTNFMYVHHMKLAIGVNFI